MAAAPSAKSRWLWLLFWFALVVVVAGAITAPKIATGCAALKKPWLTPPDAVFGPAWTACYGLMALAAWRAAGGRGPLAMPGDARTLFFGQPVLNAAGSPVFFGLEAPKTALAIIVALGAILAATVAAFLRHDRVAGLLLIPYLLWDLFASALNGAVALLN